MTIRSTCNARSGRLLSATVEAELRQRVTDLGGQILWGREVVATP